MEHIPTVFDHYSLETDVRGQRIKIEVWDQSGRDEHQNLRKFAYGKAQGIIVCFSKTDPVSFARVQSKVMAEIL
jgi:GTPase SAR1 family protein